MCCDSGPNRKNNEKSGCVEPAMTDSRGLRLMVNKCRHWLGEILVSSMGYCILRSQSIQDLISVEVLKVLFQRRIDEISSESDLRSSYLELLSRKFREDLIEAVSEGDLGYSERMLSYAQEGEDLILLRLFSGHNKGFFIDVGAHHPFRFSNTYLLYQLGWRGINIDATPGSMDLFQKFRPYDINIEAFVGDPCAPVQLTMYNEPALNTSSEAVIIDRDLQTDRYWQVDTVTLHPLRLKDLCEQYVPKGASIDLLNVDVEGAEYDVLLSNDWDRFRPKIVLVEQFASDISLCLAHPTTKILQDAGYRMFARGYNTSFFRAEEL
jgi:FkbM family methyltransferase